MSDELPLIYKALLPYFYPEKHSVQASPYGMAKRRDMVRGSEEQEVVTVRAGKSGRTDLDLHLRGYYT